MGRLVLVTGGARSGKSRYAERLVEAEGVPVVYVATMEVLDEETERRVAHHREVRPGAWRTVEEPVDLAEVLRREPAGAAVDCLIGWAATAGLVKGWQFERVAERYVLDGEMRGFLGKHNPWALRDMARRLVEAVRRDLWEAPPGMVERLEGVLLDAEGAIEDRM